MAGGERWFDIAIWRRQLRRASPRQGGTWNMRFRFQGCESRRISNAFNMSVAHLAKAGWTGSISSVHGSNWKFHRCTGIGGLGSKEIACRRIR